MLLLKLICEKYSHFELQTTLQSLQNKKQCFCFFISVTICKCLATSSLWFLVSIKHDYIYSFRVGYAGLYHLCWSQYSENGLISNAVTLVHAVTFLDFMPKLILCLKNVELLKAQLSQIFVSFRFDCFLKLFYAKLYAIYSSFWIYIHSKYTYNVTLREQFGLD